MLNAADVHVAARLAALAGEADDAVRLAVALAVRGPRLGHVHVDLATIRGTARRSTRDEPVDLDALPWPGDGLGRARGAQPARRRRGEPAAPRRARWLYLDRYWREERRVADDLEALAAHSRRSTSRASQDGLARLFRDRPGRQREAGEAAVRARLTVIAGGPGTGKTTTVARIVALLTEQAEHAAADRARRADRQGRRAARGGRARRGAHDGRRTSAREAQLLSLHASTLHRLLGWRPDSHSRFRHNRGQRLPHDVVIVDETSMVSLWQMARLVEAIRPGARLILVGDPGQLASIEAGAVLGDIVAGRRGRSSSSTRSSATAAASPSSPRRSGPATPTRRSPCSTAAPTTSAGPPRTSSAQPLAASAARARHRRRPAPATRAAAIAGSGRVPPALPAPPRPARRGRLDGPHRGLARRPAGDGWYAGRPLLVTENDYELKLYNGDTGVVVRRRAPRRRVRAQRPRARFSPARLSAVETAYAMTIHKSQGSQFDTAAVLLPEPGSRILTRELLYTAATRARERLLLAGTEEALRDAIGRPIARASGLRRRLAA